MTSQPNQPPGRRARQTARPPRSDAYHPRGRRVPETADAAFFRLDQWQQRQNEARQRAFLEAFPDIRTVIRALRNDLSRIS